MIRNTDVTPAWVLLGRGIFNLAFGIALIGLASSEAMHGSKWGGIFALVDGLFGLVWAMFTWTRARWLFALACIDAIVRILIGALLLGNPGMEASVIGSALFFSLMSVALMTFGILGAACVWWTRPRMTPAGSEDVVWPALISCALTAMLGLGVGVGFLDVDKRAALSAYCIVFGVLLCWSSRRATRNNVRRS